VCVCVIVTMCAYVYTHTHTVYSDVSPGVWTRHLESPKNPDGQNIGKCIPVYVYKVHMYHDMIYMLGGGMKSVLTAFFLLTFLPKKNSKRCERTWIPKP